MPRKFHYEDLKIKNHVVDSGKSEQVIYKFILVKAE